MADLYGKRVGTTRGSSAAAYLRERNVAFTEFDDIRTMFESLAERRLDAVVHDAPILDYHANTAGRGKARVVGAIFKEEKYGIALQDKSELRETINRALLRVRESGEHQRLREKYFGRREP